MKNQEKNESCLRAYNSLLNNMSDYVYQYSKAIPKSLAIIEHNTGEKVTWKKFNTSVSAFAAKLLSLGLKKGDIVATSLPLLKEHVYLMYACYRIGVIIAPLDLRLKAGEIQYCMDKMKPKVYFFLGNTPVADFRPMIKEVMAGSPYIKHWVQFQKEEDQILEGAVGITRFAKDIKKLYLKSVFSGAVKKARKLVTKRDACLIIFTTGSTGSPKPALLCHENILIQNLGLAVGFELTREDLMLVNLPPSHVGCTTEQLATTIYGGGTSVILHIFDPKLSLEAIQKHKITVVGQIPALFNMEWRLPEFNDYDLSTLRFLLYGGQAVSVEFLKKMKAMAPKIGTGLGLTETAGFCTYTDVDDTVEDIAAGIGFDSPLCPISIREPMKPDRSAGKELPKGEVGHICFSGKQIFLGYLDDEENTTKTISTDGICYTGDVGYYDDKGLHFSGRAKLIIKPKGYQVFPEDVESHIHTKLKGKLSMVACIGVDHEVFSEAIMVFIEPLEGQVVTVEEVMASCEDISSYSRPSHVEILKAGELPLNRVAKTDYMLLKDRGKEIIDKLRSEGKWDK
ncbi:MAG TPA: class I adenylate-forming enzyme family protein [Spirochaetota bacterium]|nr:class I adenylate-forming enzyme family protein [Spirochaetota bacterium]